MEDALDSLPDAVAIVYGDRLLYTNPAFARMFGYTAEEPGMGSLGNAVATEWHRRQHARLIEDVDRHGRAEAETVLAHRLGRPIRVTLQAAPLVVDEERAGYIVTYRVDADLGSLGARMLQGI